MKEKIRENTKVQIVRLNSAKDLSLPAYATQHSAGMDLYAANEEEIILKPMARALIPTGIKIALPENFEAQISPRSPRSAIHPAFSSSSFCSPQSTIMRAPDPSPEAPTVPDSYTYTPQPQY